MSWLDIGILWTVALVLWASRLGVSISRGEKISAEITLVIICAASAAGAFLRASA